MCLDMKWLSIINKVIEQGGKHTAKLKFPSRKCLQKIKKKPEKKKLGANPNFETYTRYYMTAKKGLRQNRKIDLKLKQDIVRIGQKEFVYSRDDFNIRVVFVI